MLDGYRNANVFRTSEEDLDAWMRGSVRRSTPQIRVEEPRPRMAPVNGVELKLPLRHVNRSRKRR